MLAGVLDLLIAEEVFQGAFAIAANGFVQAHRVAADHAEAARVFGFRTQG